MSSTDAKESLNFRASGTWKICAIQPKLQHTMTPDQHILCDHLNHKSLGAAVAPDSAPAACPAGPYLGASLMQDRHPKWR